MSLSNENQNRTHRRIKSKSKLDLNKTKVHWNAADRNSNVTMFILALPLPPDNWMKNHFNWKFEWFIWSKLNYPLNGTMATHIAGKTHCKVTHWKPYAKLKSHSIKIMDYFLRVCVLFNIQLFVLFFVCRPKKQVSIFFVLSFPSMNFTRKNVNNVKNER